MGLDWCKEIEAMKKFKLEIELENDGMQTQVDLARALRQVSKKMLEVTEIETTGKIRDSNGNTVGKWVVVDD